MSAIATIYNSQGVFFLWQRCVITEERGRGGWVWCLMENGFDEQVNGAAPKQLMENIITVKVQTKQKMSIKD